jgi:putative SOS response-associated peptidase YedK
VGTYTIIPTTATDQVGRIHDKMPMAIAKTNWDDWPNPRRNNDVEDILALITPPVARPRRC